MERWNELFDFQKETVTRLFEKRGILIAHDMGLGKTVTTIALDVIRRERFDQKARTLIICPLSVINNWATHFAKWAPHLKVCVINNKNRKPFMTDMEESFTSGSGYDVFIMHYPAIRLEPNVARFPWFHVVCDEVHALQDRKSSQSKNVKLIPAFYKTGLSGTPVFNKPDDLWSILNWLYPKYWKSYWGYFKRYIKWVEYDGYRTVVGVNNEEELQEQIANFYSRIKKEEVLKDLPDKYYSTVRVQLHPLQAKAYKQMKKDMLAWVGQHEDEPVNAPVVLAQLTRMQQFASAYAEIEYTPIRENFEHLTGYEKDMPEDDFFAKLGIKEDNKDYYKSRIILSEPSSKIDAVMEIIKNTDEPIAVFSQFAQMVTLLAKRLEKEGISHGLYTGATSKDDRDRMVDEFQAGNLKVFCGSIKAGGVGITLTAASTIVILNREWAESLNEQVIDRLHRIGQKNAVHVIDIVSEGTIDVERNMGIAMNWKVIKKLLGEL
jgi:SNF2 family DNA or RNA helicase